MSAFEVWLVPVLIELAWLASWYLTLFLGQHLWRCLEPTIWFDKLCIDQRDSARKARGIQALPGFVIQSSQLLLLYDTSYLDRLWCMTELAFFVKKHGAAHVWFLPLWLPRWLLYAQLLSTLAMATSATIGFLSLGTFLPSAGLPVLSPDRGWNHFLNNLSWLPFGLLSCFFVLLPLMRSLLDSTRVHQEMLQHLEVFEVRNCRVSDESDRVHLESLIQQAFDAMDEPMLSVAVECGVGEDQALLVPTEALLDEETKECIRPFTNYPTKEAGLDAFNEYVRGPLRRTLTQNMGSETFLSWSVCVFVFLPWSSYVLLSYLQLSLVPEWSDLPGGPLAFSICLTEWIILFMLCAPLGLPVWMQTMQAVESAMRPGWIRSLLMGCGVVLAQGLLLGMGASACGSLEAAVLTRSPTWLAAFLCLLCVIILLIAHYFGRDRVEQAWQSCLMGVRDVRCCSRPA